VAKISKTFPRTRFSARFIREALEKIDKLVAEHFMANHAEVYEYDNLTVEDFRISGNRAYLRFGDLELSRGSTELGLDALDDWLHELHSEYDSASMAIYGNSPNFILNFHNWSGYAVVTVYYPDTLVLKRIVAIFEETFTDFQAPELVEIGVEKTRPRLFIGHGGSSQEWLQLQNKLQNVHGYEVESFETGARAGHAIRDILEGFLAHDSFAVIVFSKADEREDGSFVARQNVVHEAGLFQGKLGFPRVVILAEDGVQLFSNVDGVQYIKYDTGKIDGAVGDIIGAIEREFPR
jgi:hypothetical protein